MTAREVSALLAGQAEALCRHLLPGGRREGAEWRCGSVQGEPGKSLGVHLKGPKAGIWADFAGTVRQHAFTLITIRRAIPATAQTRATQPHDQKGPVMSTNLEFNSSELKAISSVLDYLWHDEKKDYETDPRPGHIFLTLQTLNQLADRADEGARDSTA